MSTKLGKKEKKMKSSAHKSVETGKKSDLWHRRIAAARGDKWRQNVAKGRRDAILNPSLIKLMRIQKGALQSDLAAKLSLSESVFGAIERGKQPVKEATAKGIASALGAPLNKLFRSSPRDKKKYVAILKQTL